MELSNIWNLQGQLFTLFAIGLLLNKAGIFNDAAKSMLTDLVLYVTLPASIILSFRIDIDSQLIRSLLIIFFISVGTQVFCYLLSRITYKNTEASKQGVLRYSLLISNAGFMGLPIAGELFGPEGYMYASIYLIPQRIVMWTAAPATFGPASANKIEALKKVALHPCMIAVYVGLLWMVFPVQLPSFVNRTLISLGSCTTALSMMLIGAMFGNVDRKSMNIDKDLWFFSVLRLGFIPLASYVLTTLLGINPVVTGVGVILAAMPAGTSSVLLAGKYGRDTAYASKLVVLTTLFSLITIPIWAMIL